MGSSLVRKLAVISLGIVLSAPSFAQLLEQTAINMGFGAAGIGQSFVAPKTTTIGSIGIKSGQAATANLFIYNGASGSGIEESVGTPISSKSGIALTATIWDADADAIAAPFQIVTLDTPLAIVEGQSYTFVFQEAIDGNGISLAASSGNPFPTGTAVYNYAATFDEVDLAFQILEAEQSTSTPVAVPTFSEWSLAFAILMLGGGGIFTLRRQRNKMRSP